LGFSRGFNDARNNVANALEIVLRILFVGIILNAMYTVLNSTKVPASEYTTASFQEVLNTLLESIVFVFSLVGAFGVIETFSKAAYDPEWGFGYAVGLAVISSIALLVVVVLVSAPYVPQLRDLLSFVDPSSEVAAALSGTIVGLILHVAKRLIQSGLIDSDYWL